jgi:hypothetical protein
MAPATLSHYTLDTGHLRASPRSEVGPGIVEALAPLLVPGEHDVPGFGSCRVRVSIDDGTLRADIGGQAGPLVTLWTVTDAAGLERARAEAGHPAVLDLALPACLVRLRATLGDDPSTWGWLGDFERCLAWAWIVHHMPA